MRRFWHLVLSGLVTVVFGRGCFVVACSKDGEVYALLEVMIGFTD